MLEFKVKPVYICLWETQKEREYAGRVVIRQGTKYKPLRLHIRENIQKSFLGNTLHACGTAMMYKQSSICNELVVIKTGSISANLSGREGWECGSDARKIHNISKHILFHLAKSTHTLLMRTQFFLLVPGRYLLVWNTSQSHSMIILTTHYCFCHLRQQLYCEPGRAF